MKLQQKILMLFISMALLIGGPLLWTVRQTVRRVNVEEMLQRGQGKAVELAEQIAPQFATAQEHTLLPLLQATQEYTGALYVAVIDIHGHVLAHTNVAEKGKIYRDAVTLSDLTSKEPTGRAMTYRDTPAIEAMAPIRTDIGASTAEDFLFEGEHNSGHAASLGIVRLALPMNEVLARELRLIRRIAVIILISGSVGVVLLFFSMRRMLRPIQWLSAGTARIAEGNYGVSLPVTSKDELGDLTQDFNRMSHVLSETTVSKDFLGDILSHMVDPLVVIGTEGTIRMANQATLNLLGYSAEALEGQPVVILFLTRDRWSQGIENETLIPRGAARNMELEFMTKQGLKVPVLFSSSILKNGKGEASGIIATAKDMTERKKLEGAIRQSEKMSAVGQLAAGVAHEINNPLGVILGFAQALTRRLLPNDPLEMPLKSIEQEAIRCKNLVQDLLTFSRVSKVDREPIDINGAVEGAFSLIMAQARMSNVKVVKELGLDLPRVSGNLNQIQQVIINLANNALDSIGASAGMLTLKTERLQDDHLSWVCLKVIDNGPGIPDEIQPRIFEPFFTTKSVGKGTGLGLSLVHEIIKKHSGSVDIQSRPGHTEFTIKFPVRSTTRPVMPGRGV